MRSPSSPTVLGSRPRPKVGILTKLVQSCVVQHGWNFCVKQTEKNRPVPVDFLFWSNPSGHLQQPLNKYQQSLGKPEGECSTACGVVWSAPFWGIGAGCFSPPQPPAGVQSRYQAPKRRKDGDQVCIEKKQPTFFTDLKRKRRPKRDRVLLTNLVLFPVPFGQINTGLLTSWHLPRVSGHTNTFDLNCQANTPQKPMLVNSGSHSESLKALELPTTLVL